MKKFIITGSLCFTCCLTFLLILLTTGCKSSTTGYPIKKLTICGVSVQSFRIVVPEEADPAELTAARELTAGLRDATGILLETVADNVPATRHEFRIGRARGEKPKTDLKLDGFEIRTDEAGVALTGLNPRGTLYAAFGFLEECIGFRFFSRETTKILKTGKVDISAGTLISQSPIFEYRQTCWQDHVLDHMFAVKQRINAEQRIKDGERFAETGGGPRFAGGFVHTWNSLCPRSVYLKNHPEYYPFYKGQWGAKRQLCLSNPEVFKIVLQSVREILRNNPQRIISVSQDDNDEGDGKIHCQCPKCAAIDEEEGSPMGSILRFVNAVADSIADEFPDVMVETLSYQYSRKPPKVTVPRKNVIVRLCSIECCFRHPLEDTTCPKNVSFQRDIEDWNKICNELYIWDYSTNYSCYLAPFPNFEVLRENVRFYADHHVKGLYEEGPEGTGEHSGELGAYRSYLLAKLLWNPYMDDAEYARHKREFLEGYYGPGWKNVEQYIEILQRETADKHVGIFAKMDIHTQPENSAPFEGDYHKDYIGYVPYLFQPALEEDKNYLSGLLHRIDEVRTLWENTMTAAQDELTREHIRLSMLSILYLNCFCIKRDKDKLSAEALAALEADAAQFFKDKERFGVRTNIFTSRVGK